MNLHSLRNTWHYNASLTQEKLLQFLVGTKLWFLAMRCLRHSLLSGSNQKDSARSRTDLRGHLWASFCRGVVCVHPIALTWKIVRLERSSLSFAGATWLTFAFHNLVITSMSTTTTMIIIAMVTRSSTCSNACRTSSEVCRVFMQIHAAISQNNIDQYCGIYRFVPWLLFVTYREGIEGWVEPVN